MRSMYGPERMLLASKKPRIIDLIERSKNMTEEQIMALDEKPDVIRGLIGIKKKISNDHALARAEKIADEMIAANLGRNIEPPANRKL